MFFDKQVYEAHLNHILYYIDNTICPILLKLCPCCSRHKDNDIVPDKEKFADAFDIEMQDFNPPIQNIVDSDVVYTVDHKPIYIINNYL